MLCAVPFLRALRASQPDARVTLIGLPWASEFVHRFAHYVDGFLPFPGWPGIPECEPSEEYARSFRDAVCNAGFSLVVQAHGDGRVMNGFARSIPAEVHAGFVPAGFAAASPQCLPYPAHLPEPLRLLALAEHLGIPPQGEHLEFPLDAGDRAEAEDLLAEHGLHPGRYACIHAGARAQDRRWPVERFAAVARAIEARGYPVVLTGSAAERDVTRVLAALIPGRVVDLAGATSLGGLAALLARSRLLVCNDTGVSHIAAALEVPSVVVFTGSDPGRWAPTEAGRHLAVGAGNSGPPPDPNDVLDAVDELMAVAA